MRLCDLTDEQLIVHRDNYRKIANWLGAEETVSQTTGAIASAIDELIDRRKEMTALRALEMSFAYERASGVIESYCCVEAEDGDLKFYGLDDADMDLDDEVKYLDSRRLLQRHPSNPSWVAILDEGEGGER